MFHSLAFDASVHFDIAEVRVNKCTPTQICPRKRLDYLHNQQPEVTSYQWMLLCCKVFSLTSPFTFLCDDIITSRSPGKKHPILPTAWPWAGSAKQRSLEIMQEKNKKLAIFLCPFELLVGLYHIQKLVRKRSTTSTHMCSLHTASYASKRIQSCAWWKSTTDIPLEWIGTRQIQRRSNAHLAKTKILQNPHDYVHIWW